MKRPSIDNEREFDWGRTSEEYAKYRTGYPESFYDTLASLGIGKPGQHILDLGTGTGVLARAFAARGAVDTGIDIAETQIAQARHLAQADGVSATFLTRAAEDLNLAPASFDVVSAGQSWLYLDPEIVIPKVLRALKPRGSLALTHLLWLPFKDEVARKTEELVLRYNPDWSGAHYRGDMPALIPSLKDHFDLRDFERIEEPTEFTRESWRGRIRACRGIGATLPDQLIKSFDEEHDRLLQEIAPETFEVLHQMTIHVFVRKGERVGQLAARRQS